MGKQGEIIILTPNCTPRLEFVADFISTHAGITFSVKPMHDSKGQTANSDRFIICYANSPIDGAFNVFSTGLLEENGIRPVNPGVVKPHEQTLLFPAPEGFDLPFDMFSAVFYMLSRYEEYLPFYPDDYGRFEAKQSLAYLNDFLEEPVVDQWLEVLTEALSAKFPHLIFPLRRFRFNSTFDVDSPWAFRNKGWMRSSAGLVKRALQFRFCELKLSLAVLLGKQPDPFDTYAYIKQAEDRYGFSSLFFFLSGNCGPYDVNYSLNKVAFRNLLKQMKNGRSIGIHPSYGSNRSFRKLKAEFNRFTKLLGEKPLISRQHYLILKLPDTYQNLIALGIERDYTMGFASLPGFRAGTSRPFRFYDLKKEQSTSLIVHPFIVMDVTLRQYLGFTPVMAAEQISRLIAKVKTVNGIFTSLWHNESLSEHGIWKGWRWVFEEMVRQMESEK